MLIIEREWNDWLPDYKKQLAYWHNNTVEFCEQPTLIVLHSGDKAADVAGYLSNPVAKRGDYGAVLCKDGKYRRKVSAHFSFDGKEFVQQVSLRRKAWHAGGSVYGNRMDVNAFSVGIELPGPWDKVRDDEEHKKLIRLVCEVASEIPSIVEIVGHCHMDKRKRDPGPGVDWDRVVEETGLKRF